MPRKSNLAAVPPPEETEDAPIRPSDLEGQPLGDHGGVPITRVSTSITGAGDGLSEALHMTPIHLPIGAKVYVLVPCEVDSHEYDRVKEGRGANAVVHDDELVETAVLKAEGALFVDPDLVKSVVAEHMGRVFAAREAAEQAKKEARGEFKLPFAEDEEGD